MPDLRIVVYGQPAPMGSKRFMGTRGGKGVLVESSKAVKPWREAVKHAAIAAIPDLDVHWPKRGQCLVCGVPGMDQRHRVIDAITERWRGGESVDEIARDYGDPTAVLAALFPLDGPLEVDMVFSLARPQSHWRTGKSTSHLLRDNAPRRPQGTPDLSKLARATEDALTEAGAWRDDARVVEYERLAKVWCNEDPDALHIPGAVITIRSAP